MRFQKSRLITTALGLLTGMLMCAGVAAQVTGPSPLTDIAFSSPFINIGGSPQNIFVTPVPASASVASCAITSPTTPLATYNTAYFVFGPTISVSSAATGTTHAVQHTLTCGAVSKTFVVKPPTYPAEIVLSGTQLQVGSTTTQSLTVAPSPSDTVLPTCAITSTPALATVTVDARLGTQIALIPSADAITADATQTVTCGSLSSTFTVKAKEIDTSLPPKLLTLTGSGALQSGARTTLTATARYADNRERTVNPVWSSSNPVVASVSATGVVTAGVVPTSTQVTISASWTENRATVQGSMDIVVSAAPSVLTDLKLTGAGRVQSGGQVRLVLNAVYADRSSKAVSATGFTLSNPALGSVNSRGVLTVASVSADTVLTVTATYEEGGVTKTASLPITVSAAPVVLSRLTLVGATALLASGQTLNLSALGVYADTSSKPVAATWQVTGTAATVSSTGVFQASSVSVDTPVVVSASYTEAGVTVSAQFQVIIQATVPPSPIQAEVQATGTRTNFSLAVWTSATAFAPSAATLNRAATVQPAAKGRPVYKLFVLTLIPGGQVVLVDTIFTLNRNREWQGLSFPVAEYLNGVADNSVQLVEILDNLDVSIISGSKIYVGYGIDDQEMMASGRFRLVYQIQ